MDSRKPLKLSFGLWYQNFSNRQIVVSYLVKVLQSKLVGLKHSIIVQSDLGNLVDKTKEDVPDTLPVEFVQCGKTQFPIEIRHYRLEGVIRYAEVNGT